jgi:ribonucleotide monophosphatase NagD (HAD superfamily)
MTRYWHAKGGSQLDAGPFVAALHYASGIEPVVLGKPALPRLTSCGSFRL